MSDKFVTKIIWQYSEILDEETMAFLHGIAEDYRKVKNIAYSRYTGAKSINKLAPGYEILNEMRTSGLRQQLELPVVYFEMALFEAIWDIKAMWKSVKSKLMSVTNRHEGLSADEKSYIRLVLSINSVYAAVLECKSYEMPDKAKNLNVDLKRLNNKIRRWTRKYKVVPKAEKSDTFRLTPMAYTYKSGGIRIASRIDRKRVFIPLKDPTQYKRQLNVVIMENYIKIAVPIDIKVSQCYDAVKTVYCYVGYWDMLTLSNGNVYGQGLSELVKPETERLCIKNNERNKVYKVYSDSLLQGDVQKAKKIKVNNLGKIKYNRQKNKARSKTVEYINSELNRMIETEMPCKVIITSQSNYKRYAKYGQDMKAVTSRSFSGFIRERLAFKCQINGIEFVEINSKDTSFVCSGCGSVGERKNGVFKCKSCGLEMSAALNSAKNIENKYLLKG